MERAVENKTKMDSSIHEHVDMDSLESNTTGSETSDDTSQESGVAHLDAALNQSRVNNYIASDVCEQSRENTEAISLTIPADVQQDSSEMGLNHATPRTSNGLVHENGEHNNHGQIHQIARVMNRVTEDIKQDKTLFDGVDGRLNDFLSHAICDLNTMPVQEHAKSNNDSFSSNENSDSHIANPSIENHSTVGSEIHILSESDHQKSNANGTSNSSPKQECFPVEMSVIEDGLMRDTIITQSSQSCDIAVLDQIIEVAKSNKVLTHLVFDKSQIGSLNMVMLNILDYLHNRAFTIFL